MLEAEPATTFPYPRVQPQAPVRGTAPLPPQLDHLPVWEYQLVERAANKTLTQTELNTLGAKGWELVSAIRRGRQVIYYFKRTRAPGGI